MNKKFLNRDVSHTKILEYVTDLLDIHKTNYGLARTLNIE